jgi:hypothetical protein
MMMGYWRLGELSEGRFSVDCDKEMHQAGVTNSPG